MKGIEPLASFRLRGDVVSGSMIIPWIVRHHLDEASFLYRVRSRLSRARSVGVRELSRFDERLDAHLQGLFAAGSAGWRFCEIALGDVSDGTLFGATAYALKSGGTERLERCLAIGAADHTSRSGVVSAFGWSSQRLLHGTVSRLLTASESFSREVAIAACSMHGVEPGEGLARWITDSDPAVRARGMRAAGILGSVPATDAIRVGLRDADPVCQFWAAWSGVLLGEGHAALQIVKRAGRTRGPHQRRAWVLALQAISGIGAQEYLRELSAEVPKPQMIAAVGISGDPLYVPWLLAEMSDPLHARTAGEALTLLTGVSLQSERLSGSPPEDFESGPNDNPDDPNIDMDPDDGLPWPDVKKVQVWWAANQGRFQKGTRYFMGEPVSKEHCIRVLKSGYQRQRILAAQHLCLLEPGTPLFNTRAPAWRQQRLLAAM